MKDANAESQESPTDGNSNQESARHNDQIPTTNDNPTSSVTRKDIDKTHDETATTGIDHDTHTHSGASDHSNEHKN